MILFPMMLLMAFAAWQGFGKAEFVAWLIFSVLLVGAFFVAFALSWRIGVRATETKLIVRTYFRTHVFPYSELLGVQNAPYRGIFNRYSESGMFGLRMIEVQWRDGAVKPLPATLSTRRTCAAVVKPAAARVRALREAEPRPDIDTPVRTLTDESR
jgi:hypothetical protein